MTFSEIFQTLVAPYTAFAIAIATYIFNKSRDRIALIRQEKLEHYKDFVRTLNDYVVTPGNPDARYAFVGACNRMHLVASDKVLIKLSRLLEGLKISESNETLQPKLDQLIYLMRKDLGFTKNFEGPNSMQLSA
ncbi:hypothetical protein [Vreelandella sp. EE27]